MIISRNPYHQLFFLYVRNRSKQYDQYKICRLTDSHRQVYGRYWLSRDRHQSSIRNSTLLIFNRSSPVKGLNELCWSSTDRHQSSVRTNCVDLQSIVTSQAFERTMLIFNRSLPVKSSNSQLIFNRSSPVQRSSSINLQQIDWELLELNCHAIPSK